MASVKFFTILFWFAFIFGVPMDTFRHPKVFSESILRWSSVDIQEIPLSFRHLCSGVLISEYWVVTTADCMTWKTEILPRDKRTRFAENYRILAGTYFSDNRDKIGVYARCKRIIVHPDYEMNSHRNDVALIQNYQPIYESFFITYANIKDNNFHSESNEFASYVVEQWAGSDIAPNMKVVKRAKLQSVSGKSCKGTENNENYLINLQVTLFRNTRNGNGNMKFKSGDAIFQNEQLTGLMTTKKGDCYLGIRLDMHKDWILLFKDIPSGYNFSKNNASLNKFCVFNFILNFVPMYYYIR